MSDAVPEPDPDLWDKPDVEIIRYHSLDEFIAAVLDEYAGEEEPEIITAVRYRRDVVEWEHVGVLDDLIESLDDDYGNFADGGPTEKTPAMIQAETDFLNVMKQEYKPWTCSEVERQTVNVADWRKEHPAS